MKMGQQERDHKIDSAFDYVRKQHQEIQPLTHKDGFHPSHLSLSLLQSHHYVCLCISVCLFSRANNSFRRGGDVLLLSSPHRSSCSKNMASAAADVLCTKFRKLAEEIDAVAGSAFPSHLNCLLLNVKSTLDAFCNAVVCPHPAGREEVR